MKRDKRLDPALISDKTAKGWDPWGEWEECSLTCSSGTKSRERVCPGEVGLDCIGEAIQIKYCNEGPCPSECPKQSSP